jgi:cell division protein FtsX
MSAAVYAVIADARAIQRRRRVRLMLVTALAMLAAGGLALVAIERHGTRTMTLTVLLRHAATPGQARVLLGTARSEPGVAAATYVSADDALARMKERYPALVRHLHGNPLPASLQLRVRVDDVEQTRRALRRRLGASAARILVRPR